MPKEKKEVYSPENSKGETGNLPKLTEAITSQTKVIESFDVKLSERNDEISSQISKLKDFFEEKYEKQETKLKDTSNELVRCKTTLDNLKNDKENLVTLNKEKDNKIDALRDEIQKKQNSITHLSNVEQSLKELTDKYDSLKKTNDSLNDDLENTKKAAAELKSRFDKDSEKRNGEFNSLKTKLEKYESLEIDKLEKAYSIFSSFKERTRNNLKAVFETNSFLGFISNGMQWERIAGIWEQAKRKIVNDDNEDLPELRELFLILFEAYNAGYLEAPYALINPSLGSNYNSNEQLIKNQKSDGRITAVLLEGYIFKKNNTIHKAMIEVE